MKKRYKIVCRAIFTEDFLKKFPSKKKSYMQRTYYYKAISKKQALKELILNQGIHHGKKNSAWEWKIISIEEKEK